MKLNIAEKDILVGLYKHQRIPIDQYKRRARDLELLVNRFNFLTERADEPEDILHYMITQRKNGKWVRLGSSHKKMRSVEDEFLSAEEWGLLEKIYLDLNVGSDKYAYTESLRDKLEIEFAKETARLVPGRLLAAALEMRRKAGFLPTLNDSPKKPFGDIDDVAV